MPTSSYYKQQMDNLLAAMAVKRQEHRAVADGGSINYPGGADAWINEVERVRNQFYELKGQLALATKNHDEAIEAEKEAERNHQLNIIEAQTTSRITEMTRLQDMRRTEQEEQNRAREIFKATEAEKQRDHELQMALIQRDAAIAQAEAARLTAEASAKAQEQASASLDGLINGLKDNG